MAGYTKKQLEDIIAGLNVKLEKMERKLDALDSLPGTVARLEAMLEASYAENSSLKKAMEFKEKQMETMALKLNSMEQYNRSWSIRVNGLALTSEEEKCSEAVKRKVFHNLLLPMLNAAVDNGDLADVPSPDSILENAHMLPAKDGVKPIIARFFARSVKGLMFRYKKEYAPREEPATADRPGRYVYPFYEDLTSLTFKKMRAVAAHPDVEACWSVGGQLRYKLKGNSTVKKVVCVTDTVENIIK